MLNVLFALFALASTSVTASQPVATNGVTAPTNSPTRADRFAGRPQARIAFNQQVRNFQVKREDNNDILYLETLRDTWFRGEITCFGINDPRDAHGLVHLDHHSGFDRFSRIALVGLGRETSECRLDGLIALTPEEAVELKLLRPRKAVAVARVPAS